MISSTRTLCGVQIDLGLLFTAVVAFLVALNQNKELLGRNGLLPIPTYLSKLRKHFQVLLFTQINYNNMSLNSIASGQYSVPVVVYSSALKYMLTLMHLENLCLWFCRQPCLISNCSTSCSGSCNTYPAIICPVVFSQCLLPKHFYGIL